MEILLVIGLLSTISGFMSGLLGIGGGIVMTPMLLYVPPLFGIAPLGIHAVAGLTIVQGLLGCLAGAFVHNKFNFISKELTTYMGAAIFATAALGGASAGVVSSDLLLFVFASLAFIAAFLMLVPVKAESERPTADTLRFSRFRALGAASLVGLLGGLVGQGGSFILIPLMTSIVHIPTRIAIASNLAIVLIASFAGFLGKAFTGQIDWLLTIPIIVTVIPAAILGGRISNRVPIGLLRKVLAILIALAALWVWYSILL